MLLWAVSLIFVSVERSIRMARRLRASVWLKFPSAGGEPAHPGDRIRHNPTHPTPA